MGYKTEINNLDVFNYIAIELLAQLNCLKPSEKLIFKIESLLKSVHSYIVRDHFQELEQIEISNFL